MFQTLFDFGPVHWLLGDQKNTALILGVPVLISTLLLHCHKARYYRGWPIRRLIVTGLATLFVAGGLVQLGAPPFSTAERWLCGVMLVMILGAIAVMGEWLVGGRFRGEDLTIVVSVTAIVAYALVASRLVLNITSSSRVETVLSPTQHVLEVICLVCLVTLVVMLVFTAIDEVPNWLQGHRRRRNGRSNW